jgi:hypothetical protein
MPAIWGVDTFGGGPAALGCAAPQATACAIGETSSVKTHTFLFHKASFPKIKKKNGCRQHTFSNTKPSLGRGLDPKKGALHLLFLPAKFAKDFNINTIISSPSSSSRHNNI